MTDSFPINLLKCIKSGSLEINENNEKSMQLTAEDEEININLVDISFNVPNSLGFFEKLSEAREFANNLNEKNLTLSISHKDKPIMKLGKNANPKLSTMITRSKSVEITDLRELRKLDKRLRKK